MESTADIIDIATKSTENTTFNNQNDPETSGLLSENASETMAQTAEKQLHENTTNTYHFERVPESESASFRVQFVDEARTEITIWARELSTKEQENVGKNSEEISERNTAGKAREKERQLRAKATKTTATTATTFSSQNAPETSENAKETATQRAEVQVSSICHIEHVPESESTAFRVQFANNEARTERKRKELSTKKQNAEENKESSMARRKRPKPRPKSMAAKRIKTTVSTSKQRQKRRLLATAPLTRASTSASSSILRKQKPKSIAKPRPKPIKSQPPTSV